MISTDLTKLKSHTVFCEPKNGLGVCKIKTFFKKTILSLAY